MNPATANVGRLPTTYGEAAFQPDPGALGDLQQRLRQISYTLYELSVAAQDVHAPLPGEPYGQVAKKVSQVLTELAELDRIKDAIPVNVPFDVLREVDASHNPHLVTKERIERVATENSFISGQMQAVASYRELLRDALTQNFDLPHLARSATVNGAPNGPSTGERQI